MTKEELKQEAEEYATKRASKLYTRNMWDRYYQTYIDSAEPREKWIQEKDKKIAELEKENAELKETLKTYNGCGDWDNDFHTCRVYLQHEELQMYIHQLTKAKELLKRCYENYIYLEPLRSEIEQFLKDSEVENENKTVL